MIPDDDGAKIIIAAILAVIIIITGNIISGSSCRSKAIAAGMVGLDVKEACK